MGLAKKALAQMDSTLKTEIVTTQIAGMVLEEQQKYVNHLIEEGLLTPKEGGEFIEECMDDVDQMIDYRRKHAKEFVKAMALGKNAESASAQVAPEPQAPAASEVENEADPGKPNDSNL